MVPTESNTESSSGQQSTPGNNPCGMCRSMGFSSCKGHGGGSSGASGGNEGNSSEANKIIEGQSPNNGMPILNTLELSTNQSAIWSKDASEDFIYKFDNPLALMSMKLDMGRGLISFSSEKDLSKDEQTALDEYYQHIKDEFNDFKQEMTAKGLDLPQMTMDRHANNLTIKIPNPQLFDAFSQRLMDKNLVITQITQNDINSMVALQDRKNNPTANQQDLKNLTAPQDTKGELAAPGVSTAPTPFNISGGPKPKK